MLTSQKRVLSRVRMLDYLGELEKTPGEDARTTYLPPGLPPAEVENLAKEVVKQTDIPSELVGLAASSKTGAALFWNTERKCLVLPPFPIKERASFHGFTVEPLRTLIECDYRIALILVRLGAYAIGICHGEKLVSSKVGTGLIHGRHKQGGSSQARFRRHREKQIEYFLTRVCRHARERLEPHARVLDYVVYGGAWTTILSLKKQCPFVEKLDKYIQLPPLLDIPEPRQVVLEKAVNRVWSSTVIEWRED